ncbi:MAG: AAA family ATPase [Pseudanabaena sp. M046S1SP1A06QC]|nr:AAA family ATPase [Pseudanabaena sp. M046S1SP1A06QC]
MRVSDLQGGKISTLDLERTDGSPFAGGDAVISIKDEIRLSRSTADNALLLQHGTNIWTVCGTDQRSQTELEKLLERNLSVLSWVLATNPKQNNPDKLTIQVHEFVQEWRIGEFEIGVDEKIIEDIRAKHLHSSKPVEEIIEWLKSNLLIQPFVNPNSTAKPCQRMLVQTGKEVTDVSETSFQIRGKEITVDVKPTPEGKLRIEMITKARTHRNNLEIRPFILVLGDIDFCDFTIAGTMRDTVRTDLDLLVKSADSYLRLWKEYNKIESANILAKAQEFGWIRYESCKQLANGVYRFLVRSDGQDQLIAIREISDFALEASEIEPDLSGFATQRKSSGKKSGQNSQNKSFFGQVERIDLSRLNNLSIDLRPNNPEEGIEPPKSGFLFISTQGDRIRLERRLQAAERIQQAKCPMPQLGKILENRAVQIGRSQKFKSTSPATIERFGGKPTARQKEALDIAINTPDIALIQGPPGTGKTGTIAALQTRLAEIAEQNQESVAKKILLTSYQHDAVDNAASRTFVYGLPVARIGGKHNQVDAVNDTDRWRRGLIETLEIKLAQMPETAEYSELKRVQNLIFSYLLTPSDRLQTAKMLAEIYQLTLGKISSELSDLLLEQKQIYVRPESSVSNGMNSDRPELELAIKAVRSLSVDPISFADDGSLQAGKVLARLDKLPDNLQVLKPSDRHLLETAADWEPEDHGEDSPSFLSDLAALQERLLDCLTPTNAPQAIVNITNPEIESLLQQVREAFYQYVRQKDIGVRDVLEEYLYDLKNDPSGVNKMVRQYTAVLASTCQQVAGKDMSMITGSPDSIFETVIIDEAARANPLDLFIPMAKAEKRIILVGDHRQLPHMLEEEVERKLAASNEQTRDVLKLSLFERLFQQLRAREAEDGIKRTITLDTQYRMHRILGDFVSRTFYEYHGESKINTGRPDSDFVHNIPNYEGKVAAWLDVPFQRGGETKGQSKSRRVEAEHLARELRMAMEASQNLTFGVITFYRAQVAEIWEALCTEGIAERNDEGTYQVSRQWEEGRADSGKLIERLRIGTVDSFQGKEFDVVFLSMTRSNDIVAKEPKQYQQKYGFLLLENRLCVAMSRQQRLLVVVGDLGMVKSEAQKPEIERFAMREFIDFYQLCQSEHGVIWRL